MLEISIDWQTLMHHRLIPDCAKVNEDCLWKAVHLEFSKMWVPAYDTVLEHRVLAVQQQTRKHDALPVSH